MSSGPALRSSGEKRKIPHFFVTMTTTTTATTTTCRQAKRFPLGWNVMSGLIKTGRFRGRTYLSDVFSSSTSQSRCGIQRDGNRIWCLCGLYKFWRGDLVCKVIGNELAQLECQTFPRKGEKDQPSFLLFLSSSDPGERQWLSIKETLSSFLNVLEE